MLAVDLSAMVTTVMDTMATPARSVGEGLEDEHVKNCCVRTEEMECNLVQGPC